MNLDDHFLSFDQTINRKLAHRRAIGEVLVTDSVQAGPNEYLVASQVPRGHGLWNDHPRRLHDPLALVEAGRQATFVVAHRHLRVSSSRVFVMRDVDFRVTDLAAFRNARMEPLDAVLRLQVGTQEEVPGDLNSMTFAAEVSIAGASAMRSRGGVTFLPPEQYEVLRGFGGRDAAGPGGAGPPRVAPIAEALRSRADVRNIVVGNPVGAPPRYPVLVDRGHPTFYDHPLDHVPGPLLLEAARQAALAAAMGAGALAASGALVTGCAGRFDRFVEHDAPVFCAARMGDDTANGSLRCTVTFEQMGVEIARIEVELASVAG